MLIQLLRVLTLGMMILVLVQANHTDTGSDDTGNCTDSTGPIISGVVRGGVRGLEQNYLATGQNMAMQVVPLDSQICN